METQRPSSSWDGVEDHSSPPSGDAQGSLTRKQKRLQRQKLAKLYKRAAVQESNHSEAAEDYALEQAYEQHLRQLQQQHPAQHPAGIEQQQQQQQRIGRGGKGGQKRQHKAGQKQQQQHNQLPSGGGRGGKRRRRGGVFAAPGATAVTGSVDTLASSAALAVPAALPAQQFAQISDFTAGTPPAAVVLPVEEAAPAATFAWPAPIAVVAAGPYAQQQLLQTVSLGAVLPGAGLPAALLPVPALSTPAIVPAAAAPLACTPVPSRTSNEQQPQQQDWSRAAALVSHVLQMQREEAAAQALLGAAAKTAGICRLDLSAAALLISSQLAPAPAAAAAGAVAAQQPTPALVPGPADQGPANCEATEDATEPAAAAAAAGIGQAVGPAEGQRRVYVHGNYHRYYGYRYFGDQLAEDPRLAVFERKWFARRRCLDVGCNEGLITLALAQRFHPRSMLGADIDAALISRACRHLREARTAGAERVRQSRRAGVAPEERKAARATAAALSQTAFLHTDFLESDVEAGSLDTITCLSVTKWVHLNRGDEGLQALFAAFWRALAPGGLLLLEPQPWSSYRGAKSKVSREHAPPGSYFHRLEELQLRPAQFADYLCDTLGFRLVKRFGVEESSAGFDRPMLLLRKPS